MKKKYLSNLYIQPGYPVLQTLLLTLALDYWSAPIYLWIIVGILLTIVWVRSIYINITSEFVNLYEDQHKEVDELKSREIVRKARNTFDEKYDVELDENGDVKKITRKKK